MLALPFATCKKDEINFADKSLAAKVNVKNACIVSVKLFAKGPYNPRGLKFGPDGYLYVAKAGLGGTENYDDQCPELVPYDAPYYGSSTGERISKISFDCCKEYL